MFSFTKRRKVSIMNLFILMMNGFLFAKPCPEGKGEFYGRTTVIQNLTSLEREKQAAPFSRAAGKNGGIL